MRSLDTATKAALAARAVVPRDFIWVGGRNRSTGTMEYTGFWSGNGTITANVVDALTGETVARSFAGTASLIGMDEIPLTSDISIRSFNVTLGQIDETVATAIRLYDAKSGPVQIYRGLLDPDTNNLVSAAYARFVGFIDKSVITEPAEGQAGSIVMTIVSHTRELTRASTEKRSDASQKLRTATDTFYKYTPIMGQMQLFWGQASGAVVAPISGGASRKGWARQNRA